VPLSDLDPDLLHPITQMTVAEMLEGLDLNDIHKVTPADCG
jgi:hypothetical protein